MSTLRETLQRWLWMHEDRDNLYDADQIAAETRAILAAHPEPTPTDLPDPDGRWYIEARVGSQNHRGDCVRFIDDRRNLSPEEAGPRGSYDNRPAADVLREALRAAAPNEPVPYRPGLPPVWAVRAHEASGGWWQVRGCGFEQPAMSCLTASDGAMWSCGRALWDDGETLYRPTTPDGTPVAWPPKPEGEP